MRISTICYASSTGLGFQTKDFYDHIKPSKALLVDLSAHNKMPINLKWYPYSRYTRWPDTDDIDWLLKDIDVLWVTETPLNYELFDTAKKRGVKIVLQYNYEFLDYLNRPTLPKPDLFVAPTSWHIDKVKQLGPTVQLQVPFIDHPKRNIKQAKLFVHIAGRPAVHDRNGTLTFIEAALARPQYKYRLFIQPNDLIPLKEIYDKTAHLDFEIYQNTNSRMDMYELGDALILPRRYGGLCLPMLESLSVGMPVIMPDISPNRDLLPEEWLVEAKPAGSFEARTTIDLYDTDLDALIYKMDIFPARRANRYAHILAQNNLWETHKPKYLEAMENLCMI